MARPSLKRTKNTKSSAAAIVDDDFMLMLRHQPISGRYFRVLGKALVLAVLLIGGGLSELIELIFTVLLKGWLVLRLGVFS